jgi:hypothetical protein
MAKPKTAWDCAVQEFRQLDADCIHATMGCANGGEYMETTLYFASRGGLDHDVRFGGGHGWGLECPALFNEVVIGRPWRGELKGAKLSVEAKTKLSGGGGGRLRQWDDHKALLTQYFGPRVVLYAEVAMLRCKRDDVTEEKRRLNSQHSTVRGL